MGNAFWCGILKPRIAMSDSFPPAHYPEASVTTNDSAKSLPSPSPALPIVDMLPLNTVMVVANECFSLPFRLLRTTSSSRTGDVR